ASLTSLIAMVLRVTVARSAMRERKLWTGKPSSVRLVATLRSPAVERSAFATIEVRFGRGSVVIVKKEGLEDLPDMRFDVVCEHAQQHVRPNALSAAMVDRSHFEIDGLDTSERAFDGCEIFVGPYGSCGIEDGGLDVGAQDIDAVEESFGIDL